MNTNTQMRHVAPVDNPGTLIPRLVGNLCFAGNLEVNGEEITGCSLEIPSTVLATRTLPMYKQCAIIPIAELREMETALEDAANLLAEIMRDEVNHQDESEKWLRSYAPQHLFPER